MVTHQTSQSRPLRILYTAVQPGYTRNQESALELLADRGHHIHIAYPRRKRAEPGLAEALADRHENITVGPAPKRERSTPWGHIAWMFRMLADFARFLHPRFADAPLLRARVAQKIEKRLYSRAGLRARLAQWLFARMTRIRSAWLSNFLVWLFVHLEEAVPRSQSIDEFLWEQAPDLVLVTPLVNVGSEQVDWFRCAAAAGIPAGLCVASWDNLTNKGLMRVRPDRVFVWNEIQKREAVQLHGIDPSTVSVVGAQRFDDWFGRTPSRADDEFKKTVGLDPDRPYLLYLCSSAFIAPDEVEFVSRWVEALRTSDEPKLRSMGVLVRPHPQNAIQWFGVDLARRGNVSVWPWGGADVVDEDSRNDFYDSLAHSSAVVGINTTALIEAVVAGKSVYTVLAPEFRDTQEGTLHFHYLRYENGGFLHEASNLEQHLAQLREHLLGGAGDAEQLLKFTQAFVRPMGLDVPTTPLLADEIEALARDLRLTPRRTPFWAFPLRLAIGLAMGAVSVPRPFRRVSKSFRRWRAEVQAERDAEAAEVAGILYLHDTFSTEPTSLKQLLQPFADAVGLRRIGPWTGTIEDEVLCWVPFVRGLDEDGALDSTRDVVLARTENTLLYSAFSVEVRAADEGDSRPELPAGLVQVFFAPFLEGRGELKPIVKHIVYERPEPPAGSPVTDRDHVAVAFGTSEAFADGPWAKDLAARVRAAVASKQIAVVDLTGPGTDGAGAGADSGMPFVRRCAAIAHSAGFIGTWGDDSALAVLFGVPTLVIAPTNPAWATRVSLTIRMARATGAPLTIVDPHALPLLATVSARLASGVRDGRPAALA